MAEAIYRPSRIPQGISYVSRELVAQPDAPVRVRYRAVTAGTVAAETFTNDALRIDLTDRYSETIVPGSVNFTLGGRAYFDRAGSLYYGLDVATGAASVGGSINYSTGDVTFSSWTPGAASTVALRSLLTTLEGRPVTTVTFRVPVAPLRPSSLQILATPVEGGAINVTANNDGDLVAAGVVGTVDYETGVVVLQFGSPVTAAGNESEPWYDDALVDAEGKIWRPQPVFAETVRYNAVAFSYLPLDADILGLDPVRLPQDGRVPIYRRGGFVVIGHTAETAPATVGNGDVIDCGRVRLSRVRVLGADDAPITAGYTADLEAGTVTFTAVAGYAQPVRVEHRVEDMLQVSDVQISGDLAFTRAVSHAYPVGSFVSSALVTNDLKSRVSVLFDQASWNGTSWADAVSGSPASATFNDVAAPIVVTNRGSITERWALHFTSTTTFNIVGEHVGVIGTGSINTDTSPINPATDAPYFVVPALGWGSGWGAGSVLRFNTVGALAPLWLVRTVQQGPETTTEHRFTLLARGDVDAP